jgi:hypothetical protein
LLPTLNWERCGLTGRAEVAESIYRRPCQIGEETETEKTKGRTRQGRGARIRTVVFIVSASWAGIEGLSSSNEGSDVVGMRLDAGGTWPCSIASVVAVPNVQMNGLTEPSERKRDGFVNRPFLQQFG